MSKMILEVCAGDLGSVRAAKAGGASRVELCSGLAEGGMTPSFGLMTEAMRCDIDVNVLIRPRPGDFVYTQGDVDMMTLDINMAKTLGAKGVVIGALTPDGDIDMKVCRRLLERRGDLTVTFHRAFDLVRDPLEALEQVIELGCDRILTSGLAPTAEMGMPMLQTLHEAAAGRIKILAGGGVNPANAALIIASGGADELHASARSLQPSAMLFRRESVSMGTPGTDEYARPATDPALVAAILASATL